MQEAYVFTPLLLRPVQGILRALQLQLHCLVRDFRLVLIRETDSTWRHSPSVRALREMVFGLHRDLNF
jgi:hypothetical protein